MDCEPNEHAADVVTAGQARHNSSNVGGVTGQAQHNSSNVGGVTGQARHNSSNVGGVTGQVGHSSSTINENIVFECALSVFLE